jgi:2-polyprenyl-6-hydroxyphenyl methylase/3-demethylubiquinone-9 3-methyltransferase
VIFSRKKKRPADQSSPPPAPVHRIAQLQSSRVSQALLDFPGWSTNLDNIRHVLGLFFAAGHLDEASISGADVLDFGGGSGALAVILLEMGARSVTLLDPFLDDYFSQTYLTGIDGLRLFKGTIQQFTKQDASSSGPQFDLAIAISVTEHVQDLAQCLYYIRDALRPGGVFFTLHDNYYHPIGSHDNFILRYEGGQCGYFGPACWTFPERCEVSQSFRSEMALHAPWSWNDMDERSRTPENCNSCPFFKRTKPWAHLLFAEEFNDVFHTDFFTSGRSGSGLNKITPFMLRQFITEAGFDVEVWHQNLVPNEVPPELLVAPFSHNETDLKTLNIVARARVRTRSAQEGDDISKGV